MASCGPALMFLSLGRVMTLMFLLPLLFAHRPINVHSRGSVLRRMPMFYGKRSSLPASPPSPPVWSPAERSYQPRSGLGLALGLNSGLPEQLQSSQDAAASAQNIDGGDAGLLARTALGTVGDQAESLNNVIRQLAESLKSDGLYASRSRSADQDNMAGVPPAMFQKLRSYMADRRGKAGGDSRRGGRYAGGYGSQRGEDRRPIFGGYNLRMTSPSDRINRAGAASSDGKLYLKNPLSMPASQQGELEREEGARTRMLRRPLQMPGRGQQYQSDGVHPESLREVMPSAATRVDAAAPMVDHGMVAIDPSADIYDEGDKQNVYDFANILNREMTADQDEQDWGY